MFVLFGGTLIYDYLIQDLAQDATTVLDKMREEERESIQKIQRGIFYMCREVKYRGIELVDFDE